LAAASSRLVCAIAAAFAFNGGFLALPPVVTSRKYFDPEAVCTTIPSPAFPLMGEVVMNSPSSKLGDPLMLPAMDPSLFCFHLEIVGTPRGAADEFGLTVRSLSPPNTPNRFMVIPGFASLTACSAAATRVALLFLASRSVAACSFLAWASAAFCALASSASCLILSKLTLRAAAASAASLRFSSAASAFFAAACSRLSWPSFSFRSLSLFASAASCFFCSASAFRSAAASAASCFFCSASAFRSAAASAASCFFCSASAFRSAAASAASCFFCSASAFRSAAASAASCLLCSAASAASCFFCSASAFRSAAASAAARALVAASSFLVSTISVGEVSEGEGLGGGLLKAEKREKPLSSGAGSSRKYFEPDLVCTTDPVDASPVMDEVVTASPSSNDGDPLMTPDMLPSLFCFQLLTVGTPLGAFDIEAAPLDWALSSALLCFSASRSAAAASRASCTA